MYIYCHPHTDCFIVSQFFSVARHVGRLKLGSKPAQLYARLSIIPLIQHYVSTGIIVIFLCAVSCRIHTDAMNNRRRKTSLTKYLPLTLLQGFEKGYSGFACERDPETEQKLQYFDPKLRPPTLCLSRFPDAQQEALGSTLLCAGFLYSILSATSLVPKLHRGSRGPSRPSVAFPTISRLSPSPTLLQLQLNCFDFCLD